MKDSCKKWLLTGAVLSIVGAVIFVGALAIIHFDFTKLSTQKSETNTYEFHEDFDKIFINVETASVTFVPSDNGICRVACVEEENLKHTVTIQDDTLTISTVDTRKWYDYICINFWSPKVTVYLPKDVYTSLSVATVTGNIEIPDKFNFESVAVTGTTSNIACYATVSESTELHTTTGSILLGPTEAKTVHLSATTGSITAKDISCDRLTAETHTGRIRLEHVLAKDRMQLENTTGGVDFERCDAADITIKTTTGSVRGSLLSGKTFVTETATGSVHVPASTSGGRCEITTSTGSIKIEIKQD